MHKDHRDHRVPQVLLAQQALKAQLDLKDHKDQLACKGRKVTKVQ